jgi:hypothetical protein
LPKEGRESGFLAFDGSAPGGLPDYAWSLAAKIIRTFFWQKASFAFTVVKFEIV